MRRFILTLITLTAACSGGDKPVSPGDNGGGNTEPARATSVAVLRGGTQTAPAGGVVMVAPTVIVRNQRNEPMSGVAVIFAIDSGIGTVTGANATTGSDGSASVGSWTISAGRNRLRATVSDLPPVFFTANGTGEVTVLQQTVGASGGTLVVSQPGSRVHGLAISIPAGALQSTTVFTVKYSEDAASPGTHRAIAALTPEITIAMSNGGQSASAEPFTISVPATVPANHWPAAILYNRSDGAYQVLPAFPVGNGKIDFVTQHLDPVQVSSTQATGSSTAFRLASSPLVAQSGAISLIIGAVPLEELARDIDTGYRPGVDDWEFDIAAPLSGEARAPVGMALSSAWYFDHFKSSRGALNKRFQSADGVEWSNRRGLILSGLLSADFSEEPLIAYGEALMNLTVLAMEVGNTRLTPDSMAFLAAKAAMYTTGRPQILYGVEVGDTPQSRKIPMLAYRSRGSSFDVTLGTSKSGANSPRTVQLVNRIFQPTQWSYLDPSSNQYSAEIPIRAYMYAGPTAAFSAQYLNSAWNRLFSNTLSGDDWPAISLNSTEYRAVGDTLYIPDDSTRIWLECQRCTGSFTAGPLISPQAGVIGGAIWKFENNQWSNANLTIAGNGTLARRTDDGKRFGLVVFQPTAAGNRYIDWRELVVKSRTLTVTPAAATIGSNTDQTFTATYDGVLPANPIWVWNLGDGRTLQTGTNQLQARWPTPAQMPATFTVKVTLKNGPEIFATGGTTVTIHDRTAWKITSFQQASLTHTLPGENYLAFENIDVNRKLRDSLLARPAGGAIRLVATPSQLPNGIVTFGEVRAVPASGASVALSFTQANGSILSEVLAAEGVVTAPTLHNFSDIAPLGSFLNELTKSGSTLSGTLSGKAANWVFRISTAAACTPGGGTPPPYAPPPRVSPVYGSLEISATMTQAGMQGSVTFVTDVIYANVQQVLPVCSWESIGRVRRTFNFTAVPME